ncbi:hypothetical protein Zmor_020024 [Zophobas morio]|uniref:Ig-like domain-containing protein n=1 Tax=Zophobas morio TaxID=2755281 RepID=A0AA38M9J7_9CUCU|nr:hypothetical protein Zmor_020024 [Zophobas morio]
MIKFCHHELSRNSNSDLHQRFNIPRVPPLAFNRHASPQADINAYLCLQPALIPDAPVCRDTEMTVIGASLDEVLKVRCHVTADPIDITFEWQFNNSGESFDVDSKRFSTSVGNVSELMYTPASQRDYGTLTCWGSNSIGRQAEPCVFQVVPAAKPSPLTNCTLRAATNHTSDVLEVECRAGYDGGLPQRFILEAYDAYTMRLRLNLSSTETDSPVFRLDLGEMLPPTGEGFPPSLRILVYAQNAKGRSEKLVLEDIMLNDAEKRTDGSTGMSILPIAALLTGSLLTLGIAVLLIVVLAVRRKHRHCGGSHCSHQLDPSKQPKVPGQQASSRPGSMLEINTGDNRYVVAYTLKPAADCGTTPQSHVVANSSVDRQPDILNTPRGADTTTPPGLPRPDALFTPSGAERNRQQQQQSPPTFPNFLFQTLPVFRLASLLVPSTRILWKNKLRVNLRHFGGCITSYSFALFPEAQNLLIRVLGRWERKVLRTTFGGKRTENGWRRLNEEVMDTYMEQVTENKVAGTHRKTSEKKTGEEDTGKKAQKRKEDQRKGSLR